MQSLECLHEFRSDFNKIADFACGTGESTLHLIQKFKFNQCYALDFAKNLLAVARGKLLEQVNIQIIEADFERPLSISNDLDLIFCNMGLQWSYDIAKTIRLWHSYLDDKGLLLFSMPTSNNFKELAPIYKPEFMEHQQIIDLISNQRSELLCADITKITQQFDHPISALKSLKGLMLRKVHCDAVWLNKEQTIQEAIALFALSLHTLRQELSPNHFSK